MLLVVRHRSNDLSINTSSTYAGNVFDAQILGSRLSRKNANQSSGWLTKQ